MHALFSRFSTRHSLQCRPPAPPRHRFDRKIEVPPPDAQARAAFFLSTALRPEVAAHLRSAGEGRLQGQGEVKGRWQAGADGEEETMRACCCSAAQCCRSRTRSEDEAALLAAVTDGCTGSDLSALCREAAMAPLREIMQSGALARGLTDVTVRPVSFDDFAAAAEKLSSGGSSGGGLHAAAG